MKSGVAVCGVGPPMTEERYNWIQFSSILSLALSAAKRGKDLEDLYSSKEVNEFLSCLEVICNDPTAYGEIHNHITFYDIHSKLAEYLADKTNLPLDEAYRNTTHWNSKEFYKLLGDLKTCCENILRKPQERLVFGHEAKVFEDVVEYFEKHPYSKQFSRW